MKFDMHKFWKHQDCKDVFISVRSVAFDDDGRNAIVWAPWFIQGTSGYWSATLEDRIKITPEHYDKWKPYEPVGKYRY